MVSYAFLKLIHIVLFVFWLGTDLAVYYSSQFVADFSLSKETRITVAKIMSWCDLMPRICMTLFLGSGILLASKIGLNVPSWLSFIVVLICICWLAMVLTLHYKESANYHALLKKVDTFFRWLMIIVVPGVAMYFYSIGFFENTSWLLLKLGGFAFTIFCGLMIRKDLLGFNSVFAKVINGNETEDDNVLMNESLTKVKVWVWCIWIVLVIEAYIGVAKPII